MPEGHCFCALRTLLPVRQLPPEVAHKPVADLAAPQGQLLTLVARTSPVRFGIAVERRPADAQRLADVVYGERRVTTQHPRLREFLSLQDRLASALLAPRPRRFQSGFGVLDHVVSLELGEGGDDVEEQLAGGGAGVDAFVEALELDAFVLHRLDGFDQLLHGTSQAGELPDDEGVARAHEGEGFRQSRPCGLGAAGLVLEDALALRLSQRVPLQFQLLILCTNTRIADQHGLSPLVVSNPSS